MYLLGMLEGCCAEAGGAVNTFEHAAKNASPGCPKCGGSGTYMYDNTHGTICNLCCKHTLGYWKLLENYGKNNGKWCCSAGCGHLKDTKEE